MSIAGRKALIKVSGTAVGFTDEATTANGVRQRYQITDTVKRVFSPTATIVVERDTGGGYGVVPTTEYTLNRLLGTVIFALAQPVGTAVRIDGSYLPMSTAAEAKSYTWELTGQNADSGIFGDTWMTRQQLKKDIRGTIGQFRSVDPYMETQLLADTTVVLQLYSDSTAEADMLAYVLLNSQQVQAVVDGFVEQTVEWEGVIDDDGHAVSLDESSGSGGGLTVIVSDTFTRANNASSLGTSDSGHVWTAHDGTWGINTNEAYQSATVTSNLGAASVESLVADCEVQVTFTTTSGSDSQRCMFRLSNATNFLFVNAAGATYKMVASSLTLLGNVGAYANGDVCKVVLVGSSIAVYRNGSLVGAFTEAFNATATRHGLGQGSSDTAVRWDLFTVAA